jgi:hypothetical protein
VRGGFWVREEMGKQGELAGLVMFLPQIWAK